jgi:hypothetical protein
VIELDNQLAAAVVDSSTSSPSRQMRRHRRCQAHSCIAQPVRGCLCLVVSLNQQWQDAEST